MTVQCKFCLQNHPKLLDAHIIPKAFFAFGADGQERSGSKILTSKNGCYPKNAPQGVYDQKFLCAACERKIFAPWDDEAIKFFQKDLRNQYPLDSKLKIYSASEFNYENLKLFFLSVLWRAHHSEQDFYEKVNLGHKHEKIIKEILLNKNVSNCLEYPIFLRRYNSNRAGTRTIIHPIFSKKFGNLERNLYVISLAAHEIIIKVDQRDWPTDLYEFIMKPDIPLYVGLVKFEESNVYRAMMEVLNKNKDVKFRMNSH